MDTPASPIVVVDCDGRRAMWDGTDFWGDGLIATHARRAALVGHQVDVLGRVPVVAGTGDALAATAALCAYDPGRTIIVDNPEEVGRVLDAGLTGHGVFIEDDDEGPVAGE